MPDNQTLDKEVEQWNILQKHTYGIDWPKVVSAVNTIKNFAVDQAVQKAVEAERENIIDLFGKDIKKVFNEPRYSLVHNVMMMVKNDLLLSFEDSLKALKTTN